MQENSQAHLAAIHFIEQREKLLLIDGKWVPAVSGKTFETVNPSTEQVLSHVAEADKVDVDLAVKAARKAFEDPSWADITPHQRGSYLNRIARLIEEHGKELTYLDALDYGTPVSVLQMFVNASVQLFDYFAGWPTKIFGKTAPTDGSIFNYTLREPLGVCGIIIPWNSPFWSVVYKIAPALAAGNTVVIKPSELTPLSILRFGELLLEAGLPAGVVNILPGYGPTAGAAIVEHPDVNKISFTGSTPTGKGIIKSAADSLKRVSVELGGKSPLIIFEDADVDKAIQSAILGFTLNTGQVCVSSSRVFVHESIYEEVSAKLIAIVNQIKIGDGLIPDSQIGPLTSQKQLDKVESYIALGKEEGATLAAGGARVGTSGYFIQPTVFTHVKNGMRLAQEEIFGPVVALIPFKDEDDAVLQGNDTVYGLSASFWTKDVSRAHRVAKKIKAGIIWINTIYEIDPILPFGGYKLSGYGKDNGEDSINEYTQVKTVMLRLS